MSQGDWRWVRWLEMILHCWDEKSICSFHILSTQKSVHQGVPGRDPVVSDGAAEYQWSCDSLQLAASSPSYKTTIILLSPAAAPASAAALLKLHCYSHIITVAFLQPHCHSYIICYSHFAMAPLLQLHWCSFGSNPWNYNVLTICRNFLTLTACIMN